MRWNKLGLVWGPDGSRLWAKTHGMGPTPFQLNDDIIRVYLTCIDGKGRGLPVYVDLSSDDPRKVLNVGPEPLLELGAPGTFDDNGLVVLSLVQPEKGTLFLYYAGFELGTQIRYRIFTGLAISRDGGKTFKKHSQAPILDRSNEELYFRCGPFVLLDEGVFKLWYAAGSEWIQVKGKSLPVYDLRYQESKDGITWSPRGYISMAVTGQDEHGFGRPWVVKKGPKDYQLFYSIRKTSAAAYRLGYAESSDGIHWHRKDEEMGLDVSAGGFDADAIMFSSVITTKGRTFCFYNGNGFGEKGFGVAELVG
jgi:hypothetical protein